MTNTSAPLEHTEFFNHRESLADRLIQQLNIDIRSGKYAPGEKLPTEKRFIETYGVSRSVVREAVSSLKADGLLQSKQGVGVFVADPLPSKPFTIPATDFNHLENIALIQELRRSVEIESAGLAAERRSDTQMRTIQQAFYKLQTAFEEEESDIGLEDFSFHLAIAEATNNTYFADFLVYLRDQITQGLGVKYKHSKAIENREYRRLTLREHADLLQSIEERDSEQARQLMREHLTNARQYYQDLEAALSTTFSK